jgi:hypothetical protein
MTSRSSDLAVAALAACLLAACVEPQPVRSDLVEPDARFVAHEVHGGLAVDRPAGTIDAMGRRPQPTYAVRTDAGAVATLVLTAPAAVEVRDARSAGRIATVEPVWDDQAIRFTVSTRDGARLRTTTFRRVGGGAGASVLTRAVHDDLDVRGVFRADVLDDGDRRAGWFQVTSWPPSEPRVYQGVVASDGADVAPAMAVALRSEMDWIADHTLDVYRGGGGDRQRPDRGR